MRRLNDHVLVLTLVILMVLVASEAPLGGRSALLDARDPSYVASPPHSSWSDRQRFITARGNELYVGDRPFRFVGFNLFDAAGRPGSYHCAWWGALTDEELDAALQRMRSEAGATVLRFWAFQAYTRGGTDWSGIDRVIRLAKKHDMRVIPTLENGMPHCTEGGPSSMDAGRWYADSYRQARPGGASLSFQAYAERLAERYRDEPAILGWMIMNEAETENVAALHAFARDISTRLKRIDPNHLVTLGTQSSGQDGARGRDFVRLYSLPSIDFVSGHDWSFWGDDRDPLPGSPDGRILPDATTCDNFRAIGCSIAQTIVLLNKPFVMTEVGIKAWPRSTHSPEERAALLAAKMDAALINGVTGYLIWQWGKIVDEGYDVREGDPLLPVLRRRAAWLQSGTLPVQVGANTAAQLQRASPR